MFAMSAKHQLEQHLDATKKRWYKSQQAETSSSKTTKFQDTSQMEKILPQKDKSEKAEEAVLLTLKKKKLSGKQSMGDEEPRGKGT